jgi:hypothetical protein
VWHQSQNWEIDSLGERVKKRVEGINKYFNKWITSSRHFILESYLYLSSGSLHYSALAVAFFLNLHGSTILGIIIIHIENFDYIGNKVR